MSTSTSSMEFKGSFEILSSIHPCLLAASRELRPNNVEWCRYSMLFSNIGLYWPGLFWSLKMKPNKTLAFFLCYLQRVGGGSSSLHFSNWHHVHLLHKHGWVGFYESCTHEGGFIATSLFYINYHIFWYSKLWVSYVMHHLLRPWHSQRQEWILDTNAGQSEKHLRQRQPLDWFFN